ncbi:MAG: hypothetical protein ACJ0FF_03395 [Gammaproteobacteria bacterium]
MTESLNEEAYGKIDNFDAEKFFTETLDSLERNLFLEYELLILLIQMFSSYMYLPNIILISLSSPSFFGSVVTVQGIKNSELQ